MPYFPPAGDAASFETLNLEFPRPYNGLGFKTGGSYTAPAGNDIEARFPASSDFTAPSGSAVDFVVPESGPESFVGNGAVTVDFVADGSGFVVVPTFTGNGAVDVGVSPEGHGAHGVAGNGAASVGFGAEGSATVVRYELRGEVRLQGVLVNRRVRAYRRDTGALISEADTVAGRFAVHAGFAAAECYVVPIDLGEDADDWAPPVANRVMSVLASDTA